MANSGLFCIRRVTQNKWIAISKDISKVWWNDGCKAVLSSVSTNDVR